MAGRQGERDYYPSSSEEWIELERLREIIAEIESLGGSKLTVVDLLNRLGIEDDELELLKTARALVSPDVRTVIPGAGDPFAPGRRHSKPQ